jgi:hypothetical protein
MTRSGDLIELVGDSLVQFSSLSVSICLGEYIFMCSALLWKNVEKRVCGIV